MTDTIIRSTARIPSRMATPPPARRAGRGSASRSDATILVRTAVRYGITLLAVAIVFVAVAVLDRSITPAGPNALPLPVIAFAGVGAMAVSMLLRRMGVPQMPAPRRRGAAPHEYAAGTPDAAQPREDHRPTARR